MEPCAGAMSTTNEWLPRICTSSLCACDVLNLSQVQNVKACVLYDAQCVYTIKRAASRELISSGCFVLT